MRTPEGNNWFSNFKRTPDYGAFLKKPVAFFSAEYGLESFLGTYAGGLGVLAGDYIREAADQAFPLLCVGLYYREAQNSLQPAENPKIMSAQAQGLKIVTDQNNQRIVVPIPMHNRIVFAQAWQWQSGRAKVFLLDTNVEENSPHDRSITNRLYTDDRETRLKQEMLLGLGGFRLLGKMGHHASVYHLNEGHSAFLAMELVWHEMKHQRVDFYSACDFARRHVVFTNHTLVPAGQEQFATSLVSAMLEKYAEELAVPVGDIVALGTIEGSNIFSMTELSFNLSSKVNGVSKLHAVKAREVWPMNPMQSVTNGVYLARWNKIGRDDFWAKHQQNKNQLLACIKNATGEVWDENVLLFGWARRLVPYKRPLAFVEDAEKLLAIAKNKNKPARVVFSGPTDNENENSNELVVRRKKIIAEKLKGIAVFLPNYNLELAALMISGCDVWLNTPVVGSEACGTSGMKAALNGALPLSTRDGWVDEVDLAGAGWVVDEPNVGGKMLKIAHDEIIPAYYNHISNPESSDWLTRMQTGRKIIQEQFSTTRMLKEYIEQLYIPTLAQKHEHKYD